ncbi:MAG: DUF92 domain-containing protein [Chthonomonadales bacterium]
MQIITANQLILGTVLAAVFAAVSILLKFLTPLGGVAAFFVGVSVFGFGGVPFAAILLAFFISSSLLSKFRVRQKQKANSLNAKTGRRDAAQVIANGLVASLLAVGYALDLRFAPPRFCMLLFIAVMSTVNADTWATEIGGLSRRRPILISTFKKVAVGQSGAISVLGTAAALLGASFIAFVGWGFWPERSVALLWRPDMAELLACVWAGFLGCFADTLLGASIQSKYRCQICGEELEGIEHCNAPSLRFKGLRWMTNDTVNFVSSLTGLVFAIVLLKASTGVK